MKKIFITFLSIVLFIQAYSQISSCDKLFREGDSCLRKKEFDNAIDKYMLVMVNCPSKMSEAREKMQSVFDEIERLRKNAEKAQRIAEEMRRKADIAYKKADSSLRIATKLTNAFYFYDDKFALAFKDGKFYFINKSGDEIERFKKWDKAEQFNNLGFALVKDKFGSFLLDTTGDKYLLAKDIKSITFKTRAIDLSNLDLKEIPQEILIPKNLKILILKGNKIESLPPELCNLDLIHLDLVDNKIKTIPKEIEKLTNLRILDLSGNQINEIQIDFDKFINLKFLDLGNNNIVSLPKSIGLIPNLMNLSLIFNDSLDLAKLFTTFASYPKGIRLSSYNGNSNKDLLNICIPQISQIPKEIGLLQNLCELELPSSEMSSLPNEITNLKQLRKIILSENKISELPKNFGELKKLEYLDLSRNNLTKIETANCKFDNLKYLNLGYNNLKNIKCSKAIFPKLKELNITSNPILYTSVDSMRRKLLDCKVFFLSQIEVLENSYDNYSFTLQNITNLFNQKITNNEVLREREVKILIQLCNNKNIPNSEKIKFCKKLLETDYIKRYPCEIYKILGDCYFNNDPFDYKNALINYEKILKIQPENIDVLENLSVCYIYAKQFVQAEKIASRSLKVNPQNKWVNMILARAFLCQGKYEEAQKIYLEYKDVKFESNEIGKEAAIRHFEVLEKENIIPEKYKSDIGKLRELLK